MDFFEQQKYMIVQRMRMEEKLPTEKQMMDMFHVSRTVLREALSVLEACGMIRSCQGSGRYATIPDIGKQIVGSWYSPQNLRCCWIFWKFAAACWKSIRLGVRCKTQVSSNIR